MYEEKRDGAEAELPDDDDDEDEDGGWTAGREREERRDERDWDGSLDCCARDEETAWLRLLALSCAGVLLTDGKLTWRLGCCMGGGLCKVVVMLAANEQVKG